MNLILFTADQSFPGEVKIIRDAIDKGFYRIHVKRESYTNDEMKSFLSSFSEDEQKLFVVHSNYEVAESFNLAGIHLPEFRRLGNPNFASISLSPVVSTSFHSVKDFEHGVSGYEYAFIGPVFDSISKADYKGTVDVKKIDGRFKNSAVAIGGISNENLQNIFSAGLSMAAVRGFVWLASNPLDAVKQLAHKVQYLKSIKDE